MTRFYDGKKLCGITINTFEDGNYTPDFSADFYDVGSLKYSSRLDAFIVNDVDYLIEQAIDWKNGTGDFIDDFSGESWHISCERIVDVTTF